MLAHKASYEGKIAVKWRRGHKRAADARAISLSGLYRPRGGLGRG